MQKALILGWLSFLCPFTWAQTYADDAAQILYNNCTSCHHTQGIAPFSLMNYNEVSAVAFSLYDAIAQDRMPPWSPNENYTQFAHSRLLEPQEKTTLLNWLTNGYPEGNAANTPAPPIYNPTSVLGDGDLSIKMPDYASNATNQADDYVCIALPTNLTEDRVIKMMEVIPGNSQTVHHCLVYIDETATYMTDTVGGDCGGPTQAKLVGGYTPGATPLIFPSGTDLKLGMTIPAGSNIILAMHYPEGSAGAVDSTRVNFHFYPTTETGIREVSADPIIQNWSFTLPPNQITEVTGSFDAGAPGLPLPVSLLSVFPHAHLLGKSLKSYALDANSDTIRLIDIPHYDFEWQDFYFFKNIKKLPIGSVLYGEGTYDNTVNNIHNPNSPPITINPGLNTSDEMFLFYFHYMLYQPGDELYDIESLMSINTADIQQEENELFSIYPNPFNDEVDIILPENVQSSAVSIYTMQGKLVKVLSQGTTNNKVTWDGSNEKGALVNPGIYIVSVMVDGKQSYSKVVKN